MMDIFTEKPVRRIALDQRDKNDFLIKFTDPYGHWKVSREVGNVPDSLKGAYTSARHAEDAVRAYLASFPIPKKVKEVS